MSTDLREQRFTELLRTHRDRIYRLCYGYLYDRKEIDDLFQEIMVNIWRSLDQFREESALSTWVYRIAVNTALLYNKGLQRRQTLFAAWPGGGLDAGSAEDPTETLDRESRLEKLHRCIAGLKAEERLILSLLLEGLSYAEIAAIVGISAGHVGVKINRLKPALARLMQE